LRIDKKDYHMKNYFKEKASELSLSREEKNQLERILATSIVYMPNNDFLRPSLMAQIVEQKIPITSGDRLDREQERILFLQLNYFRYKREMIRRSFLCKRNRPKDKVLELITYDVKQKEIKDRLVISNMGLAIAMAHRIHLTGLDYEDLVSEGNIALLQAVDRFDCSYGFRFSTYACRAILRRMSRMAKKQYQFQGLSWVSWEPSIEKDTYLEERRLRNLNDETQIVSEIVRDNKAGLTEAESSVLQKRFSLGKKRFEPLTLKAIGQELNLSKERIRQIQKAALNKVRQVSERELITA
jgi:RNA polymerase primary sigma factor